MTESYFLGKKKKKKVKVVGNLANQNSWVGGRARILAASPKMPLEKPYEGRLSTAGLQDPLGV